MLSTLSTHECCRHCIPPDKTKATHYNTLQHTATHCAILQHTATSRYTLLQTATHYTVVHTCVCDASIHMFTNVNIFTFMRCMYTDVYGCIHMFTDLYICKDVHLCTCVCIACIQMFTNVNIITSLRCKYKDIYRDVYRCIQMYTSVKMYIRINVYAMHVYTCSKI